MTFDDFCMRSRSATPHRNQTRRRSGESMFPTKESLAQSKILHKLARRASREVSQQKRVDRDAAWRYSSELLLQRCESPGLIFRSGERHAVVNEGRITRKDSTEIGRAHV